MNLPIDMRKLENPEALDELSCEGFEAEVLETNNPGLLFLMKYKGSDRFCWARSDSNYDLLSLRNEYDRLAIDVTESMGADTKHIIGVYSKYHDTYVSIDQVSTYLDSLDKEVSVSEVDSLLPEDSLGRLANNPECFVEWAGMMINYGYDSMESTIILGYDHRKQELTWHKSCPLVLGSDLLDPDCHEVVRITGGHKRLEQMEFLEFYSSGTRKHYFIEEVGQ